MIYVLKMRKTIAIMSASVLIVSCAVTCNYKKSYNLMVEKIGLPAMNKIFTNKESVVKLLEHLSSRFKVDFTKAKDINELDAKMQKTLIRGVNQERSDIEKDDEKFTFSFDIFAQGSNVDKYSNKEAVPVVLGATYESMSKIIKGSVSLLKRPFIVLVGDRPFYPEDFTGSINEKKEQFFKSLVRKNNKYLAKKANVLKVCDVYLNDKTSHPAIKKIKMYVDLVKIVDKKQGQNGELTLGGLNNAIKDYGFVSKQAVAKIIEARKFIYTVAINHIPTENDLVKYILEDHKLIKYATIIEAKAKYQKQDRATTMDTYVEMEKYIKANKMSDKTFVLLGLKPFIYRQWLQFELMNRKQRIVQFLDYAGIESKVNDNVFADEFARLVNTIKAA
jgi:hypothetical protein